MKLFSSKQQPKTTWFFGSDLATLETDSLGYAQAIKSVLELHNRSLDGEAISLGEKPFSIAASVRSKIIKLTISGDINALQLYLKNSQDILAHEPREAVSSSSSETSKLLPKLVK